MFCSCEFVPIPRHSGALKKCNYKIRGAANMYVNTVHARCSFVIKTEEEGDVAASNFRNLTNPGLPEISWDFARPSNWIRSGNEGRKTERE